MSMQEKVNILFEEQITGWPLLGTNWEKLDSVLHKTFDFGGFTIEIQFNPKRIISSAAIISESLYFFFPVNPSIRRRYA